jgi:nucleoside-diphosphate-sugar epimerase
MRVLVTGAGGMLGRQLVELLAAQGFQVRAHDRIAADGVIAGDLCDRNHVRALLVGVDAVAHAAAIPSPGGEPDAELFVNNVVSAYTVLAEAGRAGISRIVNISSVAANGLAWSSRDVSPVRVPVTEDHPYVGDDVYGLSKQLSEIVADTMGRRWGGSVVSLRFPFVGTGERLRAHLATVHRDPGVDRAGLWAWIDTRDAARAVLVALTIAPPGHHIVTVAAPDTTANQPTRDLLARYHPGTPITRELPGFASVYATDRAQNLLGFHTEHGWRETAHPPRK